MTEGKSEMAYKKIKQPKIKLPTEIHNKLKTRSKINLYEFIPYSKLVGPDNLLELRDSAKGITSDPTGYMDMLTILGKDLYFMDGSSGIDSTDMIRGFDELLTTYVGDWDIVIAQMPAETSVQQASWGRELSKINEELNNAQTERAYLQILARREIALGEIAMGQQVEDMVTHEEYTAFIYGETQAETRQLRQEFQEKGGVAIQTRRMSKERKQSLLKLINDPTINMSLKKVSEY